MRLKLGLLNFAVIMIFALLTNFYIIGNLEDDSVAKLEENLIHTFKAYSKAMRANLEERLDIVRAFASEKEIVANMKLLSDEPKKVEENRLKLFEKLEVISRLKYFGDIFIVIDEQGVELARTLVANWKKTRFGDYQAVKDALSGKDTEDIWILDRKIMIVNLAPIRNDGKVVGALLMGNVIDEDLVKQEKTVTSGDFAYFSESRIIASSLSSGKQAALNRYIAANSAKVARVLTSKNDYFEDQVKLMDEDYIVILAPMTTLQDQGLAGFMLLRDQSHWLTAYDGSRNFLLLLSLLLIMLGISVSFIIIQKAYDAIDFMLEGAHQIIVGNKEYQFASDDEYINQLGQTFNLMIAILLGKYIPEDEDEAMAASMRGSLDGGKGGISPDQMLIEDIDENAKNSTTAPAAAEPTGIEPGTPEYYNALFREFIQAKQKAGDDISQVTKERMINKLIRAEKKLLEKYNCKSVQFNVKVENGKVTLKPSPIWK